MTEGQREIALALGNVRYLPATWDKRYGHAMHGIATSEPNKELTSSQVEWLYRLLYKYRKQLPALYQKHKYNPLCRQKEKREPLNL